MGSLQRGSDHSIAKSIRLPSYRLHRASGKAVVTLSGRDIYLGEYGTPESRTEYERVLAEWLASGRRAPGFGDGAEPLTVSALILAFWRYAETAYPKKTLSTIKLALRPLRRLYGHTLVQDFRPLALKSIQTHLNEARHPAQPERALYCRRTINHYCTEVRRLFKWGVAEGLVPAEVWHGLQAVGGLRRGRSAARETSPIGPVADADVETALEHLTPLVADMVRLQRLTGARPAEICAMTTGEIDTSGPVWTYTPRHHKTEHHGKDRNICLGPKAQAILRNYLRTELEAPLFSPAVSEQQRHAAMRAARVSRITPSQSKRDAKRARRPRIKYRDRYGVDEYRRAIWRACDAAGIPRWSPNRLRHSRATELRKQFGLDAAAAVLGHSLLETTQIYAERSQELAAKVALATG